MNARAAVMASRSLVRAFLLFGIVVQFMFATTSSSATNSDSHGNLLELTSDTFPSFVASHPTTVVEFYQPW
jgi:hypothetical protein